MKADMNWQTVMKDWSLVREEQSKLEQRVSRLEESIYQILDWREDAISGETRNIPPDLKSPVFETIKESLDHHLENP